MKICVIRHGETDWNTVGKLQGREDIPLNENGKTQAEYCGLALSNQKWKAIYTSPLLRARQTADIIANILGVHEVCEEDDLVERDYGKAAGLTESERATLFPDGIYEGIESWETLCDRVYGTVLRVAEKFYPEDIIIISHGAAIISILDEVSNHSIEAEKTWLKNTCINMLGYKNKSLNIIFYNKTYDEL